MLKKILIVDDEKDILSSLKKLLETMDYKVKTIDNGSDALKLLKKETFDLILLDVLMPSMSGRQVLEKIRKDIKLKKQKIAFITVVQPSKSGKDLISKLKPIDYFQKPITDVADFKKRIRKILK